MSCAILKPSRAVFDEFVLEIVRASRTRRSARACRARRSRVPRRRRPPSMSASERDVARVEHGARQRGRELFDVLLEPVALVREREPHPGARERLRDGPGDRALVGDAEDEPVLAVEEAHAASSILAR